MSSTSWTDEQVRALVRDNDFGKMRVELPYGLSTGGVDRSPTAEVALAPDMTGRTLLDLGCRYGYFCFEALERGAARTLGIDFDPEYVRKARLLADCKGTAGASFRVGRVEDLSRNEKFDYVLCLNVLHHLTDPLATLDTLIAITRERLVLEVAALGATDRSKVRFSRLGSWLLRRAPVIVVKPGKRRAGERYFISAPAMHALLSSYRRMFARVEILPSPHKDRYLAIGHKRRVDHLLLVCGPASPAKAALIERLARGGLVELLPGGDAGSGWVTTTFEGLPRLTQPHVAKLLVDHDPMERDERGPVLDPRDAALIDTASRVTSIAVWSAPDALAQPHAKADPRAVRETFREWLDRQATLPGEQLIVAAGEGGVRRLDRAAWEAAVSAGRPPGN
jgi:2-polyprenyl-3-methyl-5-hydroxy-6-metoxy-1,4-benzoquinol methylase